MIYIYTSQSFKLRTCTLAKEAAIRQEYLSSAPCSARIIRARTYHVGEGVAGGFIRDAAVWHLNTGRQDVGFWIVQEDKNTFTATSTQRTGGHHREQWSGMAMYIAPHPPRLQQHGHMFDSETTKS